MATAKAAKDKPNDRRAVAEELVDIHVEHRAVFSRIESLKEQLKQFATDLGTSFREVFPGKGRVSASGNKPGEFIGDVPELVIDEWKSLTDAKRQKLLEQGLVKITPTTSRPGYGRVTVDTF